MDISILRRSIQTHVVLTTSPDSANRTGSITRNQNIRRLLYPTLLESKGPDKEEEHKVAETETE